MGIKETLAGVGVGSSGSGVSLDLDLCIDQEGQRDRLPLPAGDPTGLEPEPLSTGLGRVKT